MFFDFISLFFDCSLICLWFVLWFVFHVSWFVLWFVFDLSLLCLSFFVDCSLVVLWLFFDFSLFFLIYLWFVFDCSWICLWFLFDFLWCVLFFSMIFSLELENDESHGPRASTFVSSPRRKNMSILKERLTLRGANQHISTGICLVEQQKCFTFLLVRRSNASTTVKEKW